LCCGPTVEDKFVSYLKKTDFDRLSFFYLLFVRTTMVVDAVVTKLKGMAPIIVSQLGI